MADLISKQSELHHMIHRPALDRLEKELKTFIWTMPKSDLPSYVGTGVSPPSPPLTLTKDPQLADRIYSRSEVQRYVLQKLAAELHAPMESQRTSIPFSTFREVLSTPNAVEFGRLNPRVVDRVVEPPRALRLGGDVSSSEPTNPSLVEASKALNAPQAKEATAKLIFDMASFQNMNSGVRVRSYRR